MSALTFTLKQSLPQRIDCSSLTPDRLAGKSVADIGALELQTGNRRVTVNALFDLSGEDSTRLLFRKADGRLDGIGSQMKAGSIVVEGDAGAYAGFQMQQGEMTIHGNAGAYAASGMAGGLLHVHGNVGDYLASAIPGDRKGMQGGIVIVSGNAGDRAGDQMRRGIVLIEGNAGAYCAARMLAGTIGVLGTVGDYVGYGMRRGTVLLFRTPEMHATLQDCGSHTLPFLNLMFKSFRGLPGKFAGIEQNRVRRYAGDLANDGKGEILVFE